MIWLIASVSALLSVSEGVEVHVQQFPIVGRPTTITLSAPVEHLVITYQPDAPAAIEETLKPGLSTEVEWTPARAGVVRIEAFLGDQEESVARAEISVEFDGTPVSGIVIAVMAGIILFGGAAICLRSLMRD